MAELTRLLNSPDGDSDGEMLGELYAELKKIAHSRMRGEREGHTLNATALVNEAWLRLAKSAPGEWNDRKHFYGAAAEAMRRILVESARRRLSQKRGGGEGAMPLDDDELPLTSTLPDERLLEVHDALDELEAEDEMAARVVKLRFFGGMKNAEIAALMDVSKKTVSRHWAVAKLTLYQTLGDAP